MTYKVKFLFYIPLIINCLFNSGIQLSGQEKVNISAGMGFPEFLNAGLRYQIRQVQTGLSFGTMPNIEIVTVSVDVYYHFAGLSELSARRPWYGRTGFIYWRDKGSYSISEYYYLNLRLGREFNISKRIGINLDAGAIFELSSKTKYTTSYTGSSGGGYGIYFGGISFPVLPSIGLGLFYNLY